MVLKWNLKNAKKKKKKVETLTRCNPDGGIGKVESPFMSSVNPVPQGRQGMFL